MMPFKIPDLRRRNCWGFYHTLHLRELGKCWCSSQGYSLEAEDPILWTLASTWLKTCSLNIFYRWHWKQCLCRSWSSWWRLGWELLQLFAHVIHAACSLKSVKKIFRVLAFNFQTKHPLGPLRLILMILVIWRASGKTPPRWSIGRREQWAKLGSCHSPMKMSHGHVQKIKALRYLT